MGISGMWHIYLIEFCFTLGLRHGENLHLLNTVDDIIISVRALRQIFLNSMVLCRRKRMALTLWWLPQLESHGSSLRIQGCAISAASKHVVGKMTVL